MNNEVVNSEINNIHNNNIIISSAIDPENINIKYSHSYMF